MFTGIISDKGLLREIDGASGKRLVIATAYDVDTIAIGASVACSGVCLTVVDKGADWLAFDVSGETLARTTLGDWQAGGGVNLERPLTLGDELGGHMVLGHVDGVVSVALAEEAGAEEAGAEEDAGGSRRLSLAAPDDLAGFIAAKGSVTVDGVSLTVNRVEGSVFDVNIIPHTLSVTTLGDLRAGDRANLEIDVLARYVARLREHEKDWAHQP